MKKALLTTFILFISCTFTYAQVLVSVGQFLLCSVASSFAGSMIIATTEKENISSRETFILVNMDFLRSDIATGAGDTINALAVLMEVEDASAFGKRLQANFEAIYPSYDVDYVHVSNAISSFALVDSATGEL